MAGKCALSLKVVVFMAVMLLLGGCDEDGIKVSGFVLPPGDAAKGEETFVALGCPACHTVFESDIVQPDDADYSVQLGGKMLQVKHYGHLLTSIVNPDHRVLSPYNEDKSRDGKPSSPMPDFTPTMTVEQLINVVEFLQGKYEKIPNYAGRYYYYPGL
jgi:sulfur-oxidizing protein SoxX